MASNQQQLAFAIRAVNEAGATLKQVQGQIDDVGSTAERSNSKLGGMGSALGGVAKIAGGFVLGQALFQLPGLLTGAAQAAADDEAATLRLNKALENLVARGGAAGKSLADLSADMNTQIKSGQRLAFTDDDVRDSMQKLLAATDDYDESVRRSALAMDLARGANIPLADASRLLGKINEENVQVFKRMGITLAEGATEAEALAAVQAKFGGQADAYAKSTAGQFEQAKIRLSEVKEEVGAALIPVMVSLGTVLLNDVLPRVEAVVSGFRADWLPAISAVAAVIRDDLLPPIVTVTKWLNDHKEVIVAVAAALGIYAAAMVVVQAVAFATTIIGIVTAFVAMTQAVMLRPLPRRCSTSH